MWGGREVCTSPEGMANRVMKQVHRIRRELWRLINPRSIVVYSELLTGSLLVMRVFGARHWFHIVLTEPYHK